MKADERLAEIRERERGSLMSWDYGRDVPYLLGRIDQLERLVPDWEVLLEVAEFADRSDAGGYEPGLAENITKMLALVPAIRKYREAECSPR